MCSVNGWSKAPGAVLLTLLLTGCAADTPDAVLEEYLERVARVTELTGRPAEPPSRPPYPEVRALVLELPRRTVNVAEFVELHGCDMGQLVGFRNSPLGRVQSASQRLGYHADWLRAVSRCGGDAPPWLLDLAEERRQWLPRLFWNATFAAPEMRTALGRGASAAEGDLADLLRGLNDSLSALDGSDFRIGELERLLGALRQGSWVAPARADWSRWRRYLDEVAALLDEAGPGICLNRQPTPRSRRLQNVFMKFYVERIQPELAREMRRHEAWIRELEGLVGRLEAVAPEEFLRWYRLVLSPDSPDSEWRRTERAVVAHAEAWQAVLRHCGVEPGRGLGQD